VLGDCRKCFRLLCGYGVKRVKDDSDVTNDREDAADAKEPKEAVDVYGLLYTE